MSKLVYLKARSWTPFELDGLVLWLPFDVGGSSSVQNARDLAPGGLGATRGTGIPSSADPTWVDDGLSFDGGDYASYAAAYTELPTYEFSGMFVAKIPPTSAVRFFYAEGNTVDNTAKFLLGHGASGQIFVARDNGPQYYGATSALNGYDDNVWRTYAFRAKAGTNGIRLYIDSVPDSQGLGTVGTTTFDETRIGDWRWSNGFIGSIASAVLYTAWLADDDFVLLHNYFARTLRTRGIDLPYV